MFGSSRIHSCWHTTINEWTFQELPKYGKHRGNVNEIGNCARNIRILLRNCKAANLVVEVRSLNRVWDHVW